MLIYVSCDNSESVSDLQMKDLGNCYIIASEVFGYLSDKEIGYDDLIALRLDLLSGCDVLMISQHNNAFAEAEVEFAELVGMEVKYLESTEYS